MANYNSFKKINTEAIVDDSIAASDIGTGQVTTAKIAPSAVQQDKFAGGSVSGAKLASTLDISGKTVTYRPVVDGDIAADAIAGTQMQSGAVIDSLGYTPVNTAGDTMTGQIQVANGSVLGSSGNPNSGLRIDAQTINLRENGTDRLAFNSSGHPTHSNNPAWEA